MSPYKKKRKNTTEVGPRDLGIAVLVIIMLLFRIIRSLILLLKKRTECIWHCIQDHTRRSVGESDLDNDVKYREPAQEVSKKNFSMFFRNYSCILVKKVTWFKESA